MFVETGDLEGVPLARLEGEITTLAAHINAATCRFLELVGEFDRREGWAQWGCASAAEWLSWRCGLCPRTAREHVRVAGRLRELALLRGAFARGELSFSQVRAICPARPGAPRWRIRALLEARWHSPSLSRQ